jgi:iron complex outermembrane recepter protein
MPIFLAGAAIPVHATSAAADGAASQPTQPAPAQPQQEIVVTGQALFPNIQPERNLDPTGIESYGLSTVDELVGEIENELGDTDDDPPMIVVNGEPVNDLSEIGALPVEALRNLQVLPRGSAVRLGGTASQRVISLTLNRTVHSATLTAARKIATDGDWHGSRGEAILTDIHGSTRANVTFRVNDQSSLLESQRGIIQTPPSLPYSLGGNVIGYPDTTGEIDPQLSAIAGEIVTAAPIPNVPSPTLADFAADANVPSVTDIGRFRTLRPQTDTYDLNGNFSTKLAPWLTSTATVHLSEFFNRALYGLPSALFVLPSGNAFSPFSTDVGIAVYGRNPLHFRTRMVNGDANLTLNGTFGAWRANFNAKHSESKIVSTSERQTTFGSNQLDTNIDPFTADFTALMPLGTDRTSSRSISSLAQLSLTGPLIALPAGTVETTVEGRLASNRLRSVSSFAGFGNRNVHRAEEDIRAAVDVPITSRSNGFLPQLGEISADGEYAKDHFSDAGTLTHYALGLTWEPLPLLRLHGSIEQNEVPASVQLLGGPTLETPNVSVFDPLTGNTVQVLEITGSNPFLKPETDKIRRLSALLRLVPKWNLQLNSEYTDTDRRNFVSSLPDESAAIMLAFPGRFLRDSNGNLTTIDLRPVNFESDHEERLRWGFSMNTRIGGGTPSSGPRTGPVTPTTFLQLTADHTIVFSDRIVIRSDLTPVDLLSGGAIGVGGGRVRHQLDGTGAITSGGLGARIGITWRSRSTLVAQVNGGTDTLTFSPVMTMNLRAFADGRRILSHTKWAKGLRLSVDALNVTNGRQRVRDSFGNTPLQYQPGYRDPIGRTIELEIRKVF